MKKMMLTLMLALIAVASGVAQNYIVVNSEKIFKSQADYNAALESLDKLAQQEQQKVDELFGQVESNYNRYMSVRSGMTPSQQQAQEQAILALEQQAIAYQESVFGSEGSLMQKRVELIQPIQKRVFTAIEQYAKQVGADMVIDSASNPTLIYVSDAADKTQAIIESLQ